MHTYRSTRSSSCFVDGQYTTSTIVLLHRRTRRGGSGGNGYSRSSRSKLCTYWSEPFALAGRWGWERRGVEEQGHECHCLLRLALSLKTNRRTLPLSDDELIVLASLVSFPEGVTASSTKDLSHVNGRSLFCGLKLDMNVFCARVSSFVGY